MSGLKIDDVDGPLQDIKYMAEFAAQLCSSLDSNDARSGFFEIDLSKGNQLAFCCNDVLRRVEELIGFQKTPGLSSNVAANTRHYARIIVEAHFWRNLYLGGIH